MTELAQVLGQVPISYQVYPLRSRSGKIRWIAAPNPALKLAQRLLLRQLLYRLEPHPAAHGFVPGRSIVSNARLHVGRRWVVTLDIQDFFPSTREAAVREALGRLPGIEAAEREAVLGLVTRRGALPQGAPTSPHLANLCCDALDRALESLGQASGLTYTRYADDLTFSGDLLPRDLVPEAGRILDGFGYRLASRKTSVTGQHRRQMVTGLVVNERLGLPRGLRRWLRAVLHDAALNGLEAALGRAGFPDDARLTGYLALWRMTQPERLAAELEALQEVAEKARPDLLRPEACAPYGVTPDTVEAAGRRNA